MNALLLLDDGWAAERVAEALFIDAETVREHRCQYETFGVVGVERLNYEGSEPALSQKQLVALGRELDSWTVGSIRRRSVPSIDIVSTLVALSQHQVGQGCSMLYTSEGRC
jgi:hypothetical protein